MARIGRLVRLRGIARRTGVTGAAYLGWRSHGSGHLRHPGAFPAATTGIPVPGALAAGSSGIPVPGAFAAGSGGVPVPGALPAGTSGVPKPGALPAGTSGVPMPGASWAAPVRRPGARR